MLNKKQHPFFVLLEDCNMLESDFEATVRKIFSSEWNLSDEVRATAVRCLLNGVRPGTVLGVIEDGGSWGRIQQILKEALRSCTGQ